MAAADAFAAVLDGHAARGPAEGIGPAIDRVGQHPAHAVVDRQLPDNPPKLALGLDRGQQHLLLAQPEMHLPDAPELGELAEHQADRRLHAQIRILGDPVAPDLHVAHGDAEEELAAARLLAQRLERALAQQRQLHLAQPGVRLRERGNPGLLRLEGPPVFGQAQPVQVEIAGAGRHRPTTTSLGQRPLRKSTGRVATTMRTDWPGTITWPRAAPRRSRRCARRSSRPAGAPSRPRRRPLLCPIRLRRRMRLIDGRRRRRGGLQLEHGERRHVLRRQRELASPRPPAPFGQVMRREPVTRRDFVHRHAGSQRLCNDPPLDLVRPAPPTRWPRKNLHPATELYTAHLWNSQGDPPRLNMTAINRRSAGPTEDGSGAPLTLHSTGSLPLSGRSGSTGSPTGRDWHCL